ncbi:3-keto-5-aminohexanoate cleavage protein [Thioclava sp. 15-R06ZXC-3]|uniref:3-keto-5-aminohexanoate cleavage protein n=1 Tax=Thioclava arctica TaxID=3238301 RepID=A0ABV3TIB7_9RHOB
MAQLLPERLLHNPDLQLIFVLGRYVEGQVSQPDTLLPFREWMASVRFRPDWALCAFGAGETACLQVSLQAGGKARVGFENSLLMADGSLAPDNSARVAQIAAL